MGGRGCGGACVLRATLRPAEFNVRTVPGRLAALRRDPWRDFTQTARRLPAAWRERYKAGQ